MAQAYHGQRVARVWSDSAFAEAVDRLVGRLEKAEAGAGAPDVGASCCRRSTCPTKRAASSPLDALLRRGPVAVVVHRGHWCPYCRINTRALAKAEPQIEAGGWSGRGDPPRSPAICGGDPERG